MYAERFVKIRNSAKVTRMTSSRINRLPLMLCSQKLLPSFNCLASQRVAVAVWDVLSLSDPMHNTPLVAHLHRNRSPTRTIPS